MKIFLTKNFVNGHYQLRIQKDDGTYIFASGKQCNDFMPDFGVELNSDTEDRLKKFLIQTKEEVVQMDEFNIFNQDLFKDSE